MPFEFAPFEAFVNGAFQRLALPLAQFDEDGLPLPDSAGETVELFGMIPINVTALWITGGVTLIMVALILLVVLSRAGMLTFKRIDQVVNRRASRKATDLHFQDRTVSVSQLPLIAERVRKMASGDKVDVVKLVDYILQNGVALRASDIHFDPKEVYVALQYRVDGVLYDVAQFPQTRYQNLLTRLKVLSKLKTYVKDQPQDGRVRIIQESGDEVDLRVALMPTLHGEKAVLRIMQQDGLLYGLDQLGFDASVLDEYKRIIAMPQGICLLTGPTGSGKTTTIYSTLRSIKDTRGEMVKLVTIEDPIEYDIDFLTQTQVNESKGFSFSGGLRSILRQDPDVIMVGEIRDLETAQIAIQAGLTGHLLFTSVHANSASGVFSRLINLGVEPFLLASATQAVLSQRLVRRLCPHCRVESSPSDTHLAHLARAVPEVPDGPWYRGAGCEHCLGKGYLGRQGLYELLLLNEGIRDAITRKDSTGHMEKLARESGMRTLLADGLSKCQSGQTSLEEVLRVALS